MKAKFLLMTGMVIAMGQWAFAQRPPCRCAIARQVFTV